MGKKIATCSYCGTRAVLVLNKARHELACSACGAPLHDMKFMPQVEPQKVEKPIVSKPANPRQRFDDAGHAVRSRVEKKRRKIKKRKPMFKRFLEEILDEVEDFFD